jgi:outer membrane cobalamin receptor
MIKKSSLITILLIIFCGRIALAGTTGKISGRIVDQSNNEALAGVNIVVDNTFLGASTDLDGFYFIINIPPGSYNLTITCLGYQPQHIQNVRVITDQTSIMDVKMVPSFITGEEVIIVAERPIIEVDRTFSTSTVNNTDIEVMPITKIQEVVDIQAGVVDGHFRGGRSGEVMYLLDGIPIQDNYDGSQSTQVNNSVVQELQVISGTFNAEYGQAMSGVVNMVTKEGADKFSGQASVEFGDYLSTHDDVFMHIGTVSPTAITNYEGSLTGPIPQLKNTSFYLNGRIEANEGWEYGQNRWALEHPVVLTDSGWIAIPQYGNNEYVPMNPDNNQYFYGKLMHQPTPKIKLQYSTLWSNRQYKDYDHYMKYIPEGDYHRFDLGRTNMLKMTHTLTNSMFYDIGLSNTYSEYYHYVFEDPYDPGYVNPAYLEWNPAYTLDIGGTKMEHFRRFTNTYTLQSNLSWQYNPIHFLKAGCKFDFHTLFYNSFNPINNDLYGEITDPYTPAPFNFTPYIPPIYSINHDYYLYHPFEVALYLQDKIELKSLIVNLGLRFDYFDPSGKILSDPKDPNIYNPLFPDHADDPLSERWTYWYEKPSIKTQLSPRVGIAYPISNTGVLHYAYGHFFQRPRFEYLYTNPEFELEYGTGLNTVMGNADLRVEKTVTYEFGLQQGLTEDLSLDINMFYRDIRDLVSTDTIIATYEAGTMYTQYTNRDFGTVRGITLSLDKRYSQNFSASLDYTYQIAMGNASDPQDAYNASKGDIEPLKQMVPLDWDRRHTLNLNANYMVPGDYGVSFIGTLGSGLPYTTEEDQIQMTIENDGRKPMYYNMDMSAFKDIRIDKSGRRKLTLNLTIKNLFDTLNENNVYRDTGRATYTELPNVVLEIPEINTFDEFFTRPDYYSRPREVRFGVVFQF